MANESGRPSAFALLRWPLLSLLIGVLGGAAILSAAYLYLQSEKRVSESSQRMMGDAQARMSNANRELDALKNSIDKFNLLKSRGVFADENRMDWIEHVLRLKRAKQITNLEFDLGSRKKPVIPGNKSFAAIDVFASPMAMKFQSLHEEEAFSLIDELNQASGGLFPVESCNFSLAPAVAGQASPGSRFQSDCKLVWITLEDKRQPAVSQAGGK